MTGFLLGFLIASLGWWLIECLGSGTDLARRAREHEWREARSRDWED